MKKFMVVALAGVLSFALGCGSSKTAVPAAPAGLTATTSPGTAALTWTASAKATSYNLYYSTTTGVTPATGTKIVVGPATTYTQTGLTNGTAYFFIVTAVNKGGESAGSNQVSVTPNVAVPPAPATLTATAGIAQVALSWTASAGATSYNLYYSTTTGVTTANGTKISVTSGTTYTQTSLTPGAAYYYVVTAVNAGGESAASAQATATPLFAAPAAPTALTATAGSGQVVLNWTASTGATSYNLYYSTTSPVTTMSGTKVGSLTGTSYTLTGLNNGTLYHFVLTAVDTGGESAISNEASATPTAGITVNLTPGSTATGTLPLNSNVSLTFNFPATAVSAPAVATISPLSQANLPLPLSVKAMRNGKLVPAVASIDTFEGGFSLNVDPTSLVNFNTAVGVTGTITTGAAAGSSINLAMLENNQWVDIATFVVGAGGAINENLSSVNLPGLLGPGSFLLYQPSQGTNTAVSNLGVALVADDGGVMADGSFGLQVVHIYDANGNLLPTPSISYLDYPDASDLDGEALTPDGSQGIMVDGGNTVRFFNAVETGVPVASTHTLDISAYGDDGDSIAILPNGDEGVVSADSPGGLLVVSGILSGSPVVATTIPIPNNRDGLVLSSDGKVLLARGLDGLTVFNVAPITPVAGNLGGTMSNSYTQQINLATLGNTYTEDGRDAMAISPTDSSRALVLDPTGATIQLLTNLTTTTQVGAPVAVPAGLSPFCVSISPDGKLAVVGGLGGLILYSGVDTGTLTQVGSLYTPAYQSGTISGTSTYITTLGITLDGKYVVAGDYSNRVLLVIPFTSTGFASAPAAVLTNVAVPANDQLLIH